MFSWLKRVFKGDLVGTAKTEGYRRGDRQMAAQLFHYEERPPFTLTTAELMEFDSKVTIGLAIRNGLLKQGQVKVVGGHPAMRAFVQAQWTALWARFGEKLIRTKNYGFQGFEVLYALDSNGHLKITGLKDFHPRDTRPLLHEGEIVGITVGSIKGRGKVPLFMPKSLWLTYKDKHGSNFGQALLEHAYAPWHEKWMRGGAVKLRQLRMSKDAWIGDIIRYPTNKKVILPDGSVASYRDIARELVELRQSGGVMGLPSDVDSNGNKLFDYTPPQQIDGATMIFDYGDRVDNEIMEGLEVPKEVAQASETGSGFSGRSIPFIALLSVLQEEFDGYVAQVDKQVLRPLCRLNFGAEPEYLLQPESLIETVGSKMGGEDGSHSGGGPAQAMSGPPGGFSGGAVPNLSEGGNSRNSYGQLSFSENAISHAHVYIKDRLSPRRVGSRFGAVVGGVYYRAGDWVPGDAVQLASDDELLALDGVVQLDEKWITIGGSPEGEKKHKGGFPVQIDGEGRIVNGGPKELRGKHVSEVGEHFKAARQKKTESGSDGFDDIASFFEEAGNEVAQAQAEAAKQKSNEWRSREANDPRAPGNTKSYKKIVDYQAEKWGIAPEEYEDLANQLFEEVNRVTLVRERAREYAREQTGLRIPRIAQLERQGLDHSAVKGLDAFGRYLASQHPDLGWGRGSDDENTAAFSNIDYGALVWDLVKEGQQRISKVSRDFHSQMDDYLGDMLSRQAAEWEPTENFESSYEIPD